MKDWIEKPIKRMLRKWLLKKVCSKHSTSPENFYNAAWIYNSPLCEWKDKIWCAVKDPSSAEWLYENYLKKPSKQDSLPFRCRAKWISFPHQQDK